MEKLLREMKVENKYNRTVKKEDLDIGIEYTIKAMKNVVTKYGNKLVIIINFEGEMVDIFAPKRFDSKAADFEKKFKKIEKDKGMILKVIERKGKDNNNYLDIDIELN